jgi:hypothetical protein
MVAVRMRPKYITLPYLKPARPYLIKIQIFLEDTPCRMVNDYRRFRGSVLCLLVLRDSENGGTTIVQKGRDSAVSITTRYGLGGLGIEPRGRREISYTSTLTLGHIQPRVQWVPGLFPGGTAAGACRWPPIFPLAPRLKKEQSYTTTPPLGLHDLF